MLGEKALTQTEHSLAIHHFHIDHNASCLPPKILHNHCFQFLQGITLIPREIKDNGYAKFWEVNKVSGLSENGEEQKDKNEKKKQLLFKRAKKIIKSLLTHVKKFGTLSM